MRRKTTDRGALRKGKAISFYAARCVGCPRVVERGTHKNDKASLPPKGRKEAVEEVRHFPGVPGDVMV